MAEAKERGPDRDTDMACVKAFVADTAYNVAGIAVRQKEEGTDLENSRLAEVRPDS